MILKSRPPTDDMARSAAFEQSTEFAATLRAWRLARGMTQDQLAEVSGLTNQSN